MDLEKGIVDVIKPFVSKNTLDTLTSTMNHLGSVEWIMQASRQPEFDKVAYVLAYYLEETKS